MDMDGELERVSAALKQYIERAGIVDISVVGDHIQISLRPATFRVNQEWVRQLLAEAGLTAEVEFVKKDMPETSELSFIQGGKPIVQFPGPRTRVISPWSEDQGPISEGDDVIYGL